jgi:hypothetical protein
MTSTPASVGGGIEPGHCPHQQFDFSIFLFDRVVEEFDLTNFDAGLMSPL